MSDYFGNSPSVENQPRFYSRHLWIKVIEPNGQEFWQTPCGKKQKTYVHYDIGHNMRWCKKCKEYIDCGGG